MATTPSTPAGSPPSQPPNFYAQAAQGQQSAASPASPKPDHAEDTSKFRRAVEKLLTVFSQMEKLKPNGQDISKELKAMAQTLKDTQSKVFEGTDGGDGMDLNIDAGAGAGGGAGGAGGGGAPAAGTTPATPPTSGTGA